MQRDGTSSTPMTRLRPPPVWVRAMVVVAVFGAILWYASRRSIPPEPRTLSVYCFSAMEDVMGREILPAFQRAWKKQTGEKLEFITAFAGSGIIVDRILDEFTPEVALVSSEIDAFRLSRAGAVPGTIWKSLPNRGVVSRSPMVLVARPGNPKGIARFSDLAGEGVRVVHPDPETSGCGIWSLIGMYSEAEEEQDAAADLILSAWRNVTAEPQSARAALGAFAQGDADVLVAYEQQMLEAAASGPAPGEVVYPKPTMMTEHVVVEVPRNIRPRNRDLVDAFLVFLWSGEAQDMFAAHGFRSVDEARNGNAVDVGDARTLDDLGGAQAVGRRVVDTIWREQVLPGLQARNAPGS